MGRIWRNRSMIAIFIFLIIIVIITGIIATYNKSKINPIISSKRYDATKEIEEATEKLADNSEEAQVIRDVKATEKVVALSFKGLSDTKTNGKILDILEKYERKGSFFVPGILAAEDSEIIQRMNDEGHQIGSNSLSGTAKMEEFTTDELIEDFAKANNILFNLSGKTPTTLMLNGTTLTSEVLRAAFACKNEQLVESTHFISYQSFQKYDQVFDYVQGLEKGSILTIKMDGVLEEDEYEPIVDPDTPAVDKKPGIDTEKKLEEIPEEKLVQIVEWMLQALEETGFKTVFPDELSSYEDTDLSIDFSVYREKNGGKLAKVYTKVSISNSMISFTFRGIGNGERLDSILDYLKKIDMKATFFVTVEDILNYPDRIQRILDKGHEVANGGMSGQNLTSMDFNEICLEIYKCDQLLKEKFNINSDRIMPVYGKYNDLVLEAASSLGYFVVTYSKNPITDKSQTIDEIMKYFKNGFKKGDIVFFRLDFHNNVLEAVEKTYEHIENRGYQMVSLATLFQNKLETGGFYASSKKSTTLQTPSVNTGATASESTSAQTDGSSNSDTNPTSPSSRDQLIAQLRLANNGTKAVEQGTIYTTDQALSYTFYGISRTDVLEDVLNKLDTLGAKGTFYITEKEVNTQGAQIKRISDRGHEIGICLAEATGIDFNSVINSILNIQEGVEKICGQKPVLVRYAYDLTISQEALEAISSTGCTPIWQDLSVASSALGTGATLSDVMKHIFNQGNISVRKGYIIYYRMDYYSDSSLIGNIMLTIVKERIDTVAYDDGIPNNGSSYQLKTLGNLMNSNKVYTYPLKSESILSSVKDVIHEGYLAGLSEADKFGIFKNYYTGNPNLTSATTLPGFSSEELEQIDKTGRFTSDKTLFLTIDDWGSDKPVNHILYVLRKYNIKATFFIRTNYMLDNPNLLRTIAEEGHDIGSHTDEHLAFATTENVEKEDDTSAIYYSLTPEEIMERKADLKTSYDKLQRVIGDIETDGRPALTTIFRPPTLAMSKSGMETIFDMGFTYVLNGDFSTHDYEETDAAVLANKIITGVPNGSSTITLQNGSVLVLHMSDDTSVPTGNMDVTAQALDIVIPKLLSEGYSFRKVSDYLPYNR